MNRPLRHPSRIRSLWPALTSLIVAVAAAGADRPDWRWLQSHDAPWFSTPEASQIIANILSHQAPAGDWPKNMDTSAATFSGDRNRLRGTFDNNATVHELRFLARAVGATGRREVREAVERGVRHVLNAQYPNGGWPQSYPPGEGYPRHITFNDGTMVNLLELVRDVAQTPEFAFLDNELRRQAQVAFERGVDCILRCQVRVETRLTVWCAQHDEKTLEPRPARRFEPASLSGGESAGILIFLMTLKEPKPAVVEAVRAGVAWFDAAQLTGIRVVTRDGDRVVEDAPGAAPVWARFYEIGTQRPLFAGRDGVLRYRLADIERERRTGYAWFGDWGARVSRAYSRWPYR